MPDDAGSVGQPGKFEHLSLIKNIARYFLAHNHLALPFSRPLRQSELLKVCITEKLASTFLVNLLAETPSLTYPQNRRSVEALTLCWVRSSTFSLNQAKSRGTTILRPTIFSIISRNICSMLQRYRNKSSQHTKSQYFD